MEKLELEFRYVIPYTNVEKEEQTDEGQWNSDYRLVWSDCCDAIDSLDGRMFDEEERDVSGIGLARIEVREKPSRK